MQQPARSPRIDCTNDEEKDDDNVILLNLTRFMILSPAKPNLIYDFI